MANTYNLIEAKTLTTNTASIEFTSIPATYTDLKVVFSIRHSTATISDDALISFNANTSNFTSRRIYGSGSTVNMDTNARVSGTTPGSTAAANTFGNNEIYIPNYTSNNYKSFYTDQVGENSITGSYQIITAGLWSNTAAINAIKLQPGDGGNFVTHSTFYLYGIKKN